LAMGKARLKVRQYWFARAWGERLNQAKSATTPGEPEPVSVCPSGRVKSAM
jgi:hypothetical protein